jgi:hypothetical protein
MSFEFTPRWKEELVCECADGRLVVEITMGILHVYFPSEARWSRDAPTAAMGALEEYFDARRKAAEFQDLAQARAVDAAKVLTKVGHPSLRDAGELLDLSHERVSQVLSKKLESTPKASTSTKATAKKTVTFDRGALLLRSAEPARKKQAKRARGAA